MGKASPTEGTLPGAVYFIAKYKDFKAAAQANAMERAREISAARECSLFLQERRERQNKIITKVLVACSWY